MGHFSLDIDPEGLRKAARSFGEAEDYIRGKSSVVTGTPDEIGDSWTGQAATSVKGEMTGLGGLMASGDRAFSGRLDDVQQALLTLAGHYEQGEEDLAALNTRWSDVQTEFDESQPPAGSTGDGGGQGNGGGETPTERRDRKQGDVSSDFEDLKERLKQRTRECGEALIKSPPTVSYGYYGSTPSYSTNPDLLLTTLTLTGRHLESADAARERGAEAARTIDDVVEGEASLADLQAMLEGQSEAFRQGFIDNLDPEALRRLHALPAAGGDDADAHGELITAIGTILAQGSNPTTQPNYPPDPSKFDDIFETYTSAPEGTPEDRVGDEEDRGYLLFSELVGAGQGDGATWESGLLAGWARDTFQHERDRRADDEYWTWSDIANETPLTTEAAASWNWDETPAWGDPTVMFNEALGKDPDAAVAAYTLDGKADTELLHYMYDRDGGGAPYIQHNLTLGDALVAATSHVGPGGEGTQNFVSAEIASDHVDYWANAEGDQAQRYSGLEEATTDILTQHVQAVNHAGTYADVDTAAIEPYAGGTLPYEKIALANLDRDELQKVLQLSFGLDYYSNEISEEDDKGNSFPLYTQLATAMEVAARNDVILAAQAGDNGPDGLLERTVRTLSSNQELTNNAFREALIGEGRGEDEANADARAALDFTLGLVTDQVPVDRVPGAGGEFAGLGLDAVKGLVVDGLIPETNYEAQAEADVSTEDYRRQLTSLKLVEWLDDAGVLPEEHSPETWARNNPDAASFVDDNGQLPSIQDLYNNRNDSPEDQQAWVDFKRYYENEGGAWLAEIDVDEQYQLGWIIEDAGG